AYNDSKALTEAQRSSLLAQMQRDDCMGYATDSLSAAFISRSMLSRERTSLNAIAYASTAKLIRKALERGVNITEAYVDTVGDAERYKIRLSADFPGIAFTVCPKADALFPIVSAASIAAKVTRDEETKNLPLPAGLPISREFGSGYPADPYTKKWLESSVDPVFGFPSIVRFSWATCTPLLAAANAVEVAWEVDAEEGDAGQSKISFGAKKAIQPPRHSFFRARKLQRVREGICSPDVEAQDCAVY
ncbi:hypothetical protein H632_c3476p0, partial [Helicosporidium sp. ATCC 50920]